MLGNEHAIVMTATILLVCVGSAVAQKGGSTPMTPWTRCSPSRSGNTARTGVADDIAWRNRLRQADDKMMQGDFATAASMFIALAAEAERSGATAEQSGVVLSGLAMAYQAAGRYLDAERCFRCVLMLLENGNPQGQICTLNRLMWLYLSSGQKDKAERIGKRIAGALATAPTAPDEERFAYWSHQAALDITQKRYEAAEEVLGPALREAERKLGAEHLLTAALLNMSGLLAVRQKKWLEAVGHYERALNIAIKLYGPDHPESAKVLSNLAIVYGQAGMTREAEEAFREALNVMESRLGPNHPDVAWILAGRASLLRRLHRTNEAKALEKRVRTIMADNDAANLLNQTVDVRSLNSQPRR